MEFKREATEYTEKNSNHKAAEKFPVACKWIKQWRPNKYFYGRECDESKKSLFVASNRWVKNNRYVVKQQQHRKIPKD